MKFLAQLDKATDKNDSLLCIGLDVDLAKIPQNFLKTLSSILTRLSLMRPNN